MFLLLPLLLALLPLLLALLCLEGSGAAQPRLWGWFWPFRGPVIGVALASWPRVFPASRKHVAQKRGQIGMVRSSVSRQLPGQGFLP
jgi:hypothetical protein